MYKHIVETKAKPCRVLGTGLPSWLSVKNPPAKAGVAGLIPGLGRSPGEGNGIPLEHSYLGNPMDREDWQATVHEVSKEWDTT